MNHIDAGARSPRELRKMSTSLGLAKHRFLLNFSVISIAGLLLLQTSTAHAAGIIETGPFAGLGSLGAFLLCLSLGGGGGGPDGSGGSCRTIALLVDPPSSGVDSLAMTLQYDSDKFVFNSQNSGFLCSFSSNGDCPPVSASPGTFPVDILPSSGFNPGQPLPGSSVTLNDTGGSVALDYQLASPVNIDQDTNFFLFAFDFKQPQIISVSRSTVTYSASSPGSDFTQTSFVCHTDVIPDLGCGSAHGITGITLNLTPVPEPPTWLMLGAGLVGLLGYGWRRRNQTA
jgi:hypothetical protein